MSRAASFLRLLEVVGADHLLRPWVSGKGVIFVLHRAAPAGTAPLDPDMTITTDVLDHALRVTRAEGYDIIGLDAIADRLRDKRAGRFAAFTFDDGYRDNLDVALPVFRAHAAPFAVYVASGLIDRKASYWWGAMARVVEVTRKVDLGSLGVEGTIPTGTWQEKRDAFALLQRWVHVDLETRSSAALNWCRAHGIDAQAELDTAMMSWGELRSLAANPLVTIGAHTVTHRRLAKLDATSVEEELSFSKAQIEGALGTPVNHFAYPFGGPAACGLREFELVAKAGYQTAVTTRNGNLFPEHHNYLTALPRRRLTEGPPDLRTARRALIGTQWLLKRGPRAVKE